MANLPQWDVEASVAERRALLHNVAAPRSPAVVGEQMALDMASRTPEKVAEFLKDTDNETLAGIVACMIEAQKILKQRVDLVTAVLDRMEAVEDHAGGAHG